MISLLARCRLIATSLWFGPLCVALFVGLMIAVNVTGGGPLIRDRPGYTLDETFNVAPGIAMAESLRSGDIVAYRKACDLLTDHPPLGRIGLGLAHEFSLDAAALTGLRIPENPIDTARLGSAAAFTLTLFLAGWTAGQWYGRFAGFATAVSIALMPRLFGHAHLAALESCMSLTYLATILYVGHRWTVAVPTWKSAAVGGVLLGLALLTKIQAVFLPVSVGLWTICVWRQKGIVALVVWSLVGLCVFFVGWPWLWSDPWGHFYQYFGRTTERSVTLAWYFGQQLKDRDVPWHYPWVMFLTTVPHGLHLLGAWGCVCGKQSSPLSVGADAEILRGSRSSEGAFALGESGPHYGQDVLMGLAILVPLLVFSLPKVAVYDAERLFLMVFPLWGMFIGRGAQGLWNDHQAWRCWLGRGFVVAVWALALWGLVAIAPCYLSYYNLLTGGVSGAARLGLPVTYWSDSLTPEFLEEVAQAVPPGSTVQVAPVMEPLTQLNVLSHVPSLRDRRLRLVPWHTHSSPWLLLFERQDYLDPEFRLPPKYEPVCALRRQGVILAALYHLR